MFKKIDDALNRCEENKFQILATITITSVLCMACYIAGLKDGSRNIFML